MNFNFVEEQITEKLDEAKEEETEESLEEILAEEEEATVEEEPDSEEVKEEKVKKRKKKEEEEEYVEDRTYTIPLGKAFLVPPRKRAPKAMRIVKAFVYRHMKIPTRAEEEDEEVPSLVITNDVNERIWGRGIEKPPRRIRIRATKDKEGNVTVHLAEGE